MPKHTKTPKLKRKASPNPRNSPLLLPYIEDDSLTERRIKKQFMGIEDLLQVIHL
jgi:hypothetical protein